jgi:hypothetical protein
MRKKHQEHRGPACRVEWYEALTNSVFHVLLVTVSKEVLRICYTQPHTLAIHYSGTAFAISGGGTPHWGDGKERLDKSGYRPDGCWSGPRFNQGRRGKGSLRLKGTSCCGGLSCRQVQVVT